MRWLVRSIASIVLVAGFSLVWITPRVQAQRTKNSVTVQTHRGVVIEFMRFIRNSEHTYAQYKVTNFGAEPVRYPGFAVNTSCMILIRQGALIKAPPSIWGTHLFGNYSLAPGKTFVNDVQIPDEKEQFEIGFAYEIGAKRRWTIAWSGKVDYPATAGSRGL